MQRKERRSRNRRRGNTERRSVNDPGYNGQERRSEMGSRSVEDRMVLA